MACFIVGGAEAVVVTAVRSAVKKSEERRGIVDESGKQISDPAEHGICWTRKISWLMNMLWGGVILLCVEHMWHGEVVPFPPFLTAMSDPAEIPVMFHEMATVGVAMCVMVAVVWLVATVVADMAVKRSIHFAAKEV